MKTKYFLSDPVFQLNLLIWMAKEQPQNNFRVRPFFFERDFKIIYIEQPFKFSVETISAIQNASLEISIEPEPEMILGRQDNGKALYFEAKSNSFTKESDNSKQARAHLLAAGPVFGEVLAPLSSCLLCYVLPDSKAKDMNVCLKDLTHELRFNGLSPGPFSVHGLSLEGSSLVYSWDLSFKEYIDADEDKIAILENLDENTDPTPLLLVFSDEDCSNPQMRNFYREALIQQVRAILLCDLQPFQVGQVYQVTADMLLLRTTDGVFSFIGRTRQKNMRRFVRHSIFRKIHESWSSKQDGISYDGDRLSIQWQNSDQKDDFLNWLEDRRVLFDASRSPEEKQIPLFEKPNKPNDG